MAYVFDPAAIDQKLPQCRPAGKAARSVSQGTVDPRPCRVWDGWDWTRIMIWPSSRLLMVIAGQFQDLFDRHGPAPHPFWHVSVLVEQPAQGRSTSHTSPAPLESHIDAVPRFARRVLDSTQATMWPPARPLAVCVSPSQDLRNRQCGRSARLCTPRCSTSNLASE